MKNQFIVTLAPFILDLQGDLAYALSVMFTITQAAAG